MLGQGRELTGLPVVAIVLLAWLVTALWRGTQWLIAQFGWASGPPGRYGSDKIAGPGHP